MHNSSKPVIIHWYTPGILAHKGGSRRIRNQLPQPQVMNIIIEVGLLGSTQIHTPVRLKCFFHSLQPGVMADLTS